MRPNITKLLISLLGVLFIVQIHFAQNPSRCLSDEKMEVIYGEYPFFIKAVEESKKAFYDAKKQTRSESQAAVTVIPVHVVIVHPPGQPVGTGANLSLAHILSQITVLNQDFRRLNTDAGNTPPVFPAADAEIEFCMATVDPSGAPTDGITRYATNQNLNSNEFAIKAATTWDRNQYLNMYVGENTGALGWAYLPTTSSLPNPILDGIVVETGAFGGPGFAWLAPYNLGRTATHEIGHFLGLFHVWGGGGCGSDDGMADTPIQDSPNWGCPNHPSPSCGNGGDMFMNYLDYVDDNCMNAFTVDQAAYMNLILNTSRASLAGSAATNCGSAPPPLALALLAQTDVSCFGHNDGQVVVQASGGASNYQYNINNGPWQSSGTFPNLTAGTYTLTAQDGSGTTVGLTAEIFEPPQMFINVVSQGDVSCFGLDDGFLIVIGLGGTPFPGNIYEYNINGGPYSNQEFFDNLLAGPHTVGILDANDCAEYMTIEIYQPDELELDIDSLENVNCYGSENGFVEIFADGGTPDYSYSLDDENYQSDDFFEDLPPDEYTAYVLDFNNCFAEIGFTIEEPDSLELIVDDQSDILCYGDSTAFVTLEAFGGTPIGAGGDYEYSIDSSNFQFDPSFENLGAGTYDFYVLDANGCSAQTNTEIIEPEELTLELLSQTNIPCAGDESGDFSVEAYGGTPGYLYALSADTSNSDGFFENLGAGVYEVTVEDENLCLDTLQVELTESPLLEIEIIATMDVSCFGGNDGSATAQASGGNGGYLYSLDGVNFSSSNGFDSLSAGNYAVIVQDAEGCLSQTNFAIFEPSLLSGEIVTLTEPDCFGGDDGSLEVSASGGTGNFEYKLENETNTTGIFENLSAGNYELIVTDANDCSTTVLATLSQPNELIVNVLEMNEPDCPGNSTGAAQVEGMGGTGAFEYTLDDEMNTTGVFENLAAGNYSVLVSDENNCTARKDFEITEPSPLMAEIEAITDAGCAGASDGSVAISANGGTGDYEFNLGNETNTTGIFDHLSEGTYMVSVEDANGCQTSIEAAVGEGADIEISATQISNVICFGQSTGFAQLSASGGVGGFEYFLDNQSNTSGLFENLPAGNYLATATDSEGCQKTFEFEITQPEAMSASVSDIQNVACHGDATGSFQVMATGGAGSFEFFIPNENNENGLFENLKAGAYEIIVADANGCSTTIPATIEEPAPITLSNADIVNVSCFGGNDGFVQATATGGTGTLTFTLGDETNDTGYFENLPAANHVLHIEDESGCESIPVLVVNEPDKLTATVTNVQNINCSGTNEGAFQVVATGGVGDYQFERDGQGNNSGLFEGLEAGDYSVLVTDGNGCQTNISATITQSEELSADISNLIPVDCHGNHSGFVSVVVSGGSGSYTYSIDNETNDTGMFENLAAGIYKLVIEDEFDCQTTIEFEITQPDIFSAQVTDIQKDNGSGTGTFTLLVNGGTPPYSYSLDNQNFQNENTFEQLAAGIYTANIMDSNGCLTEAEVEIELETAVVDLEGGLLWLAVMPNPFSDELWVEMDLAFSQNVQLTLFNINGQVVGQIEKPLSSGPSFLNYTIMESLASGTYVLNVRGEQFNHFFKLIKVGG